MNYKYKKYQIFGKRLKVPKDVLSRVYFSELSLEDYIKYELYDKIPISCVLENSRKVIERFGIDKLKNLDFETLGKVMNPEEILMSISADTNDINNDLYEKVKNEIEPEYYSQKMKEIYSDRLFVLDKNDEYYQKKQKFNSGNMNDLSIIIDNWDMCKNKDLDYNLFRDPKNSFKITSDQVRYFMNEFENIHELISKKIDLYEFIFNINNLKDESERKRYIKNITDEILKTNNNYSNEQYKELFKYSSIEEYLNQRFGGTNELCIQLKNLPEDYIYKISLSIVFNNYNKIGFLGLKNIIEVDNECSNFLTKNDCEILKIVINNTTVQGQKIVSNKNEFYELIRKLVLSNNFKLEDLPSEFKAKFPNLFISELAPQELKKEFYDRTIDIQFILSHPEYLKYLRNIDLKLIYNKIHIYTRNEKAKYNDIISLLEQTYGYEKAFNILLDYGKIFESLGNYYTINYSSMEDLLDSIDKEIAKEIKINHNKIRYDENVTHLKNNYPALFLSKDAPDELKKAFYDRTIDSKFILAHPEYIKYLKNVDLDVLYSDILYTINGKKITSLLEQTYGHDKAFNLLLDYGIFFESIGELDVHFESLTEQLSNFLGFLSSKAPIDIKERFYRKNLSINDFISNPQLLELFDNTNIALGFPSKLDWIIPLFSNQDMKSGNYNRLRIIFETYKINDEALERVFKKYILNNVDDLTNLSLVSDILLRISYSNSEEIKSVRESLASQILHTKNPVESLNKIEAIFLGNNIPTIGKVYSCFEILHPNLEGFDFTSEKMSPTLKNASPMGRKVIIFSDLIKASLGSNNKSINNYLNTIEIGTKLYESIKSGNIKYEDLDEEYQKKLATFSKYLITLYNNTLKVKSGGEVYYNSTNDVLKDINELIKKLSPNGNLDYKIEDRIVEMFCGFSGIRTLEQAKEYVKQSVEHADLRNRKMAQSNIYLEKGDFVKGLGRSGIEYLKNILQNGSVACEYLGASSGRNVTPLDTDLSMIIQPEKTLMGTIGQTAATSFGPIWLVLKNDDRFDITRTKDETKYEKRNLSKIEAFYTGVMDEGHYGIRTGFSSSEINYMVVGNYDYRIGLEIAMNGFYIPVVDGNGKLVFTPNDYDKLREKMGGLSYYGLEKYNFSNNLVTDETTFLATQIEENNSETKAKETKIVNIIKEVTDELGLGLKTKIGEDLTEGIVELVDTGSTGRKTNLSKDSDFDFIMKLDKKLILNHIKFEELREKILEKIGKENINDLKITAAGDLRLKKVKLDKDTIVDIDITFTNKTDKVSYSTDMAIKDRLSNIQKQNPEKYKYVVANILLAKKVLKEAEAYKPNRGDVPQGGLGGSGIENWILQNGGSFIDAAKNFVSSAEGKDFDEFKASNQIWDFGDNHLANRREIYPHDDFISNNMSEKGYKKMLDTLKKYLQNVNVEEIEQSNKHTL